MDIFVALERNKKFMKMYNNMKSRKEQKEKEKRVKGKYVFEDRKKDYKNLCIILAGYKDYLYEDIFERLVKFCPKDNMDVCIVSSGKYSEKLSYIAKQNDWSYLSTKRNNVALTQNIAINLYKNAEKIFKLDEDIFITENFFTQCLETFDRVTNDGEYEIGFVAPSIPINGYSHVDVLKMAGLLEDFENKFGKAHRDSRGKKSYIVNNSGIAKYMWGENNEVFKNIDALSKKLSEKEFSYSVCPIIFSIGAILFTRDLWEEMGRFKVTKGTSMGADEAQICGHCMAESKAIIVSENTLVGHFSYGPQTKTMIEYYNNNRDVFKIKD